MFAATARYELQSRVQACALATCGFTVAPKAYRTDAKGTKGGKQYLTWSVTGPRAAEAAALIASAALPVEHPKSLRRTKPEHPYLVCLASLGNLAAVRDWLKQPLNVPACRPEPVKSRLLRLHHPYGAGDVPEDLITMLSPSKKEGHTSAVSGPPVLAALITCGFVPHPWWYPGEGGGPFLRFRAESDSFSGLFLQALSISGPEAALQGMPAGEHPWCYAVQCLANFAGFDAAEEAARKNPVIMMKQERGPRAALVSRELLDGPDGGRNFDIVARHLA